MKKRVVLGAVAGAVVVGLLGRGGWWWSHPTVLSDEGMGLGSGSFAPEPIGKSVFHVGVAGNPWEKSRHETVTLRGFQPHFRTDGAGTKVTLLVCVPRMFADGTPNVIGAATGSLDEFCTKATPVEDGTKMSLERREYLVATLTPTRTGKSNLTAITVDYDRSAKHFWQQGSDRIDGGVTVTATR